MPAATKPKIKPNARYAAGFISFPFFVDNYSMYNGV
jgi:hypothetical protein